MLLPFLIHTLLPYAALLLLLSRRTISIDFSTKFSRSKAVSSSKMPLPSEPIISCL